MMIYFPFFLCLVLGLFFLVASYLIFDRRAKDAAPGYLRENYEVFIGLAVLAGATLLALSVVYWWQVITPLLKAGG